MAWRLEKRLAEGEATGRASRVKAVASSVRARGSTCSDFLNHSWCCMMAGQLKLKPKASRRVPWQPPRSDVSLPFRPRCWHESRTCDRRREVRAEPILPSFLPPLLQGTQARPLLGFRVKALHRVEQLPVGAPTNSIDLFVHGSIASNLQDNQKKGIHFYICLRSSVLEFDWNNSQVRIKIWSHRFSMQWGRGLCWSSDGSSLWQDWDCEDRTRSFSYYSTLVGSTWSCFSVEENEKLSSLQLQLCLNQSVTF